MLFRDEKGSFALVAILVLGAFAFVGGIYYFAGSSRSERQGANPLEMYERLRADAERALSTPDAVNASLPRNSNAFSCLYGPIGDCARKGSNFILYDSGEVNAQPLSQLGVGTGLSADGMGCRGFPSEQCPLRVEAAWDPVCTAGGRCENTKSMHVKVKVSFNDGVTKSPLDWEKSGLFSPIIQLSQGALCERGGGVWANTECLTPEQIAQRQLASASARSPRVEGQRYEEQHAPPVITPETPDQFICPNQIVVQGVYYPVDFISAGKGQVKVPAMNGCQAEDSFVFQCNRKEPAQFEGEGQWIQTEAVMAGSDCQSQIGGQDATGYQRR